MYRKIMVDPGQFGSRSFQKATRIVKVPIPSKPLPGEVMLRVTAAGVQASDIIQMAGGYGTLSQKKPDTEATGGMQPGDLGCEGVGVITSVGDGVDTDEWPVGQPVAFSGYGVAFREMTMLPVRSPEFSSIFKIPSATPEWTAFPVSALTAVGGLEAIGKIRTFGSKKPSVFVTGAAGGTGHIAVQWAKNIYGARVAGTCGSPAKAEMLASLGVDVVVNYRTSANVEDELRDAFPDGFDIVYDGVGGRIGDVGRRLLAPNGVFVGIGSVSQDYSGTKGADDHNKDEGKTPLKEGQSETFFFLPAGPKIMGQAAYDEMVARTIEEMANGRIRVVLDEACKDYAGIEGIYEAQDRMRTGKNVGKIYASFPAEESSV